MTAARTDWRDGAPPLSGWYETAEGLRNTETRRHWNGRAWSPFVFVGESDSTTQRVRDGHRLPSLKVRWRGLAEQPRSAPLIRHYRPLLGFSPWV